jgi:ATP-dependent helicase/nuclease subunit B
MQEALLRASHGVPILLPRLVPLGLDSDEEVDILLASTMPPEASHVWQDMLTQLRPAVHPVQRSLQLAAMIRAHQAQLTIEQAVTLAQSLATLMDDFARDGVSLEALRGVVQDEFAQHWQVSLDFLDVIIRDWPVWLESQGLMDGVQRRNQLLGMLAQCWQLYPPAHPIIAAGTTGSVPATAMLLKVIAHLPQGSAVLPALDVQMADDVWEILEPTHPQFGMKELLARLEVGRNGVQCIGGTGAVQESSSVDEYTAPAVQLRQRLFSEVMLPPAATSVWMEGDASDHAWLREAVQGLGWITCDTEEQEAFMVAMTMREVLETPERTAMLVTHDRVLARQVAAMMGIFGVVVDDSAGQPLLTTPQAVFLRLILQCCDTHAAPASLLALLRHPLCGLGFAPERVRRASRVIEKKFLRCVRPEGGLQGLMQRCMEELPDAHDADETLVLQRLDSAMQPLWELWQDDESATPFVSFQQMLVRLKDVALELASTDSDDGSQRVWGGFAGNQLARSVQSLLDYAPLAGTFSVRFFTGVFEELLAKDVFRPPYALHPRVRILSPLEARMQSADVVILGGLNEGVWPSALQGNAWLSKAMRKHVGLTEEERVIGLSAHDFCALVCAPRVLMTRAKKSGGAPAIASRWLLRLEARLRANPDASDALLASQQQMLALYEAWVRPVAVEPALPPEPCPPLAARPKSLSVTRVETLLRDPYSIYASKILRLSKLDDVDKELTVSDFGNAVHKALELFYGKYPSVMPDDVLAELLLCGREAFHAFFDTVRVRRFWWPRYEKIAVAIAQEDTQRVAQGRQMVRVEEYVEMALLGDFTLHGIVDRIEEYADGSLQIIDYKTGALPKPTDVDRGLACQLHLLRMMLEKTARQSHVVDALYWKISGGRHKIDDVSAVRRKDTVTSDDILSGVLGVFQHYNQSGSVYRCCPMPDDAPNYNDYEHLARKDEWF